MSIKARIIVVGILVSTLLALGLGTVALAQGPTTTPTPPAAGTPSTATSPAVAPARALANLFWQARAQRLGITVDKLQAAVAGAIQDALSQGVKQGLLTQNQADAIKKREQNLGLGRLLAPVAPGRGANARRTAYVSIATAGLDAAAKTLGMTTSDLRTALRTQTLLALAQQKNVDVTALRTAIANAEKDAVDAAVKAGELTQAQGNALKARLTPDNIDLVRGFRGGLVPGLPGLNPGALRNGNDAR